MMSRENATPLFIPDTCCDPESFLPLRLISKHDGAFDQLDKLVQKNQKKTTDVSAPIKSNPWLSG